VNEIRSAVLMRFSRAVERSTSGSLIFLFLFLFFYDTLSSLVLGDLTASERVKKRSGEPRGSVRLSHLKCKGRESFGGTPVILPIRFSALHESRTLTMAGRARGVGL